MTSYPCDKYEQITPSYLLSLKDSSNFHEEWALGVIVILFKDGDKSELNNYRGITLLSMLGKLLVGVLNNIMRSS